jgi:hypothetical protein
MLVVWLGAVMIVGGLLYMAAQPMWRDRLSGGRWRMAAAQPTLEPPRPGAGLGPKRNWPGRAMVALGALLMLVGAV